MPIFQLLLDLLAQVPQPAPEAGQVAKLTTIGGLTTLEIILISACTTLSGVIGVVWKWGNDIRKENAVKFDVQAATIIKLSVDQTADNKDIVHALQDVGKTMNRVVDNKDVPNSLTDIDKKMDKVVDTLDRIERQGSGAA
jgi:hypothetical protein